MLVTAIAPLAWGSTYYITNAVLPPGEPLWGAVIRALPAGVLLYVVRRRRPRGAWWWRSAVLGVLNTGGFFALVYAAAQLLPSSIASTLMATSPLAMMGFGRLFLAERPRLLALIGAVIGAIGVTVMLWGGGTGVHPLGILASLAAMLLSSIGYVLATRWSDGVDVFSSTSWQLLAGGLIVVPFALVVEGAPPHLDAAALAGFAYVTVIATAVAFIAWFSGLRHLGAGTVGLIGLLNPVAGVVLGTVVAGETLGLRQGVGLAIVLGGILLGQSARASRKSRVGAKNVVPVAAVEKSRMRS